MALSDVVRFCFPAPSSEDLFPDDNYHQNRRRGGGGAPANEDEYNDAPNSPNGADSGERGSRRPAGPNSGASYRFVRPEEDDLSKGVLPLTLGHAVRHYLSDWVLAAVLWGSFAIMNRSAGHKREFSLKDLSIQHTFAEQERVPPYLLAVISVGIPALVILPISSLVARSKWDVHNGFIGLFMSYTVTGVVTQLIKMSVGRPRPDLISRCMPHTGAADHPVFGLSTHAICTTTNTLRLDDGFKSFPSGHSSLSFAGLGFLALYLAGKMHLHDKRGHRTRAWVALSPLLGGVMVAVSRTMDNRHHWQDVLVGSLLGMFIAWVAYRTYYPGLKHRQCHLPLAPRGVGLGSDEEQMYNYSPNPNSNSERGQAHRTRLLQDADPRPSEEEVAWRGSR